MPNMFIASCELSKVVQGFGFSLTQPIIIDTTNTDNTVNTTYLHPYY